MWLVGNAQNSCCNVWTQSSNQMFLTVQVLRQILWNHWPLKYGKYSIYGWMDGWIEYIQVMLIPWWSYRTTLTSNLPLLSHCCYVILSYHRTILFPKGWFAWYKFMSLQVLWTGDWMLFEIPNYLASNERSHWSTVWSINGVVGDSDHETSSLDSTKSFTLVFLVHENLSISVLSQFP